jgi:phosphate uptake regulator
MDRHFDGDLKALEKKMLGMGALCESMIQKTVKALVERDSALTRRSVLHGNRGQPASTWRSTIPW